MENLILSPIPVEQLKSEISETVKKEIQLFLSLLHQPQVQRSKYLTRKETAKRLGISLPTLNDWTKEGIVIGYRIASRVRYKEDEIEAALIKIKTTRRAA